MRFYIGELDLTQPPFMVDQETQFGAPQKVAEVVDSMLRDGELVVSDRTSNRELTLTVYIEESDLTALALAEDALIAETDKPLNTLTVDPATEHDPAAPVTVFDTFRIQATFVADVNRERVGMRRYDLTIPALPYVRSNVKVTVPALSSGSAGPTVIDDGTGVTWTVDSLDPPGSSTAATQGGGLVSGALISAGNRTVVTGGTTYYSTTLGSRLTKTIASPINMSATPYLQADVKIDTLLDGPLYLIATGDGATLTELSEAPAPTAGYVRYTWLCTDPSLNAISFSLRGPYGTEGFRRGTVTVDQLIRTDVAPTSSGNGRELLRTSNIAGSVRTPATIAVAKAGTALGKTVVYTSRGLAGLSPSLRAYATSAGSSDVTGQAITGRYNSNTMTVVPPAGMMERGGYVLWASLRAATVDLTAVDIAFSAQSAYGSTLFGRVQTGTTRLPTLVAGPPALVPLGTLTLPPSESPLGAATSVSITASGTDVMFDNLYIFFCGPGSALTVVDCGVGTPAAGGPSSRLWIEPATAVMPRQRVFVGTQADQSDARAPGADLTSWGSHDLEPGDVAIFTVTANASTASVDTSFYPAGHTHMAR